MTKICRDNFNKKELVNNLKSKFGTSTKNIEKIFDDIIDSLINVILSKNSLSIKNFAQIRITLKKERVGRNPKTKEMFLISARNTVSLITSKNFKKEINKH
tara:strand:- start:360 stop:662 length:303 start_codon:yes stop_codon:yes gene_type:complete